MDPQRTSLRCLEAPIPLRHVPRPTERTHQKIRDAVQDVGRARGQGVRDFGDAVVTQLRTAASDLLRVTGCDPTSANQEVRNAMRHGEDSVQAGGMSEFVDAASVAGQGKEHVRASSVLWAFLPHWRTTAYGVNAQLLGVAGQRVQETADQGVLAGAVADGGVQGAVDVRLADG